MKKLTALIFIPLLFLVGCASTQVSGSAADADGFSATLANEKADSSAAKKNQKNEKKENGVFDDWKYKGFGYELPAWVEPAIEGNVKKVAAFFAESVQGCTEANLEIVMSSGKNVDQSENKMKSTIQSKDLGKKQMLDGVWVRYNAEKNIAEPYVTVLVFKK